MPAHLVFSMEVLQIDIENMLATIQENDVLFGSDNSLYRELFDICMQSTSDTLDKLALYPADDLWDFILYMASVEYRWNHEPICIEEVQAYFLLSDVILDTPAVTLASTSDSKFCNDTIYFL